MFCNVYSESREIFWFCRKKNWGEPLQFDDRRWWKNMGVFVRRRFGNFIFFKIQTFLNIKSMNQQFNILWNVGRIPTYLLNQKLRNRSINSLKLDSDDEVNFDKLDSFLLCVLRFNQFFFKLPYFNFFNFSNFGFKIFKNVFNWFYFYLIFLI